jgi:NADPH:quinone reductase-like Zn-dependent oxidoreductase
VQLAKAGGAQVTAIDSAPKQPLLRALGADVVIDYRREDFTTGAERYDLIFDVASNLSYAACRRTLRPGGRYVLIGHDHFGRSGGRWLGSVPRALALAARSAVSPPLRPAFHAQIPGDQALPVLRELLAARKLTPIIAQTYPLSEARAALRHLMSGEALGRIVITP